MEETQEKKPAAQYPFYIHDQYVKDLSFENPNFLLKYSENHQQPQVSVNVETRIDKVAENNYEVSMFITVKSNAGEISVFVLDLSYGALVSVSPGLTPEVLESLLLVHCSFLMFPFAREIVANVTKAGGYPPLLIEPVDFASLYLEKRKETAKPDGVDNEQKTE
jgi:preprotein translocase subunit SecB